MAKAVGDELSGRGGQAVGHELKMGDTDREDYAAGGKDFAVIESQAEAVGGTLDAGNHLVFEFGDQAVAEGQSIAGEGIEADWNGGVAVFYATFGAEFLQGQG